MNMLMAFAGGWTAGDSPAMGDLFNKHIKKATARTKEKLLEGLGKAKATQDDAFDFHLANLNKQSKACERLHKDLKAYTAALKTLTAAEKTLRETVRDSYEPEWPERQNICAITQSLDIQTDELEKKVEELMGSVGQYVAQFTDLKAKCAKRGRKLVDFDSAKNNYNSLKASSKKADSDPKLAKAFTELQQAETLYRELNNELLEVLPATYDSRITFFADTLQTLFNAHSLNQTESSKLNKQLVTQLDQLGTNLDALRVARPENLAPSPVSSSPSATLQSPEVPASTPSPVPQDSQPTSPPRRSVPEEEKCETKLYPALNATKSEEKKDEEKKEDKKDKREKDSTNPFDESDEDVEQVQADEVAAKVLYRVRATHEYKAVDSDELSFAAGTTIAVVEPMADEELDEGWQVGIVEGSGGQRGVFPVNFTKRLD